MKSYFSLYKKAKKFFLDGKIQLTNIKENGSDIYFFIVNDYDVRLELTLVNKVWIRNWSCGCASFAINERTRCSHIMAAEYFLINNSYSTVVPKSL